MNPINNSLSTENVYTNILLNRVSNKCENCRSHSNISFGSIISALAKRELENSIITKNQINTIKDLSSKHNIQIPLDNKNVQSQIESAITEASNKYNIDENLLKAIIKTESNFDKDAVSHAGAKGLMQIMPSNYEYLDITNPFDVNQNINGGAKLLREYLDRFDQDIEMALMAYNGGPTRMDNRGVKSINDIYKMPKETQNYVAKVMNEYKGS